MIDAGYEYEYEYRLSHRIVHKNGNKGDWKFDDLYEDYDKVEYAMRIAREMLNECKRMEFLVERRIVTPWLDVVRGERTPTRNERDLIHTQGGVE